jgi:LmbE family N-acetylglucosaminyl deacetylase
METTGAFPFTTTAHPLRVVCVGAHPDDPETGCGGTLARLASAGHEITIVYLTRGEAGVKHLPKECVTWNPCDEKASLSLMRSEEARRASALLGARALFADQPDGATTADDKECSKFTELLASLNPDLVLTHWPIDTHRDHRSASLLAYQAWECSGQKFVLGYYEVMTGVQTQEFQPNWYVDVSENWLAKRGACYAHQSQSPSRFYRYHSKLSRQRGQEVGFPRAEAFRLLNRESRQVA